MSQLLELIVVQKLRILDSGVATCCVSLVDFQGDVGQFDVLDVYWRYFLVLLG